MLVVTRAGRLREWSQGELRLYVHVISEVSNKIKVEFTNDMQTALP